MDNDDYVNGGGFCCDDTPKMRSFIPNQNDNPELFQYYYHADHLGSSSLITNLDGEVVRHIEYVPFGEVFIEERNNKWNTLYLFNAKELDEETGLYYYGARYYDPRTSIWTSADPLQEKYPNISTYAYTAQNPIKYIDPNGEDIVIVGKNNSSITIATDLIDVNINAGSLLGDFGGNYNLAGTEVLIATLDIVGIFDPTGIADIAAATLEASEGNWGSALLSGLGVIPYVGDLGKVAKVSKHVKTIEKAIEGAKALDKSIDARKATKRIPKATEKIKEVGSYTNKHQSGKKYHGKGDKKRMNDSAKEKAKDHKDPVVEQDYTPAKNDRDAFKQEDRRIQQDGGIGGGRNYNKRNSPGRNYRKQDGD